MYVLLYVLLYVIPNHTKIITKRYKRYIAYNHILPPPPSYINLVKKKM